MNTPEQTSMTSNVISEQASEVKNETRPGYYAIIPASVRYDDSIPANAKLLYGEITALANAEGYCYAGNNYFATLYGMAEETISRLIAKLEKSGHLKRIIERDNTGQITSRRLYISVSASDAHPLDKKINTPRQKNQEGIDEKVKENITSNNIKKENKKEKAEPLTDKQLQELFISWIIRIAGETWSTDEKNQVFFALVGFYEPRETKKQQPMRSKSAFTALSNRLVRFSDCEPSVIIDLLERATSSGWKSVYPYNDVQQQDSWGKEEWF